ncbi:RNA polymerase sigma factor [Allokutzneria sp. A3M-2-11 16]|uniref:RNA polymerase sigma factor n=1 Tax=Allokutzneria sp. A3M-2-11 16 TaxID=2962043 RepID=UPI0020B840B9|nr:RNA polymerase sigma factor [Allokutzneria sp. A3M-2-11 16]MCP3801897.1 RNA polymerase sigma factor [Allokutzneria sp. A3M-2-11 16]
MLHPGISDLAGGQPSWALVEPLYTAHRPAARAAAASILGPAHDVEDIIQDATVKAAQRIHTLRDSARARSWYLSIVSRQALDRWRQRARQHQRTATSSLDQLADGLEAGRNTLRVLPVEDYPALRLAFEFIDTLPGKQRTAYLLRHYFGMDRDTIAEVLGCGTATVSVHLFRAQAKVDKEFR